jgi:hypothetical protein
LEASRIRPPDVAQAKDVPVLRLGIWRLVVVYDVHPRNDVLKSYGVWTIFSAGMFPHLSVTVVAVNKQVTLFELRICVRRHQDFAVNLADCKCCIGGQMFHIMSNFGKSDVIIEAGKWQFLLIFQLMINISRLLFGNFDLANHLPVFLRSNNSNL